MEFDDKKYIRCRVAEEDN